ncbi:MAG: hypothetical protein LC122_09630 [Chitinophagales bacterium]|nr:hypothetical protein [Chitinophagales bacterium]
MSKSDEIWVTEYLTEKLEIKFANSKFILNGWGQVDNYCKINDNTYFFLEVETKQKHPCTNVLKLYPYLEEHKNLKIILVQYYFTNSPGLNSNRGKLSFWLGMKLQELFKNRFYYFREVYEENTSEINKQILTLIQTIK